MFVKRLNVFVWLPSEDHLGRAVLPMAELRRTPSSRQIVPLQGRPGGHEGTSGSLTVEVSRRHVCVSSDFSIRIGFFHVW